MDDRVKNSDKERQHEGWVVEETIAFDILRDTHTRIHIHVHIHKHEWKM